MNELNFDFTVIVKKGTTVIECNDELLGVVSGDVKKEINANAQLMAQAPEMLKELRKMRVILEGTINTLVGQDLNKERQLENEHVLFNALTGINSVIDKAES